jgi:hypothetical protein
VAIGLISRYDVYPATYNDPEISQPRVVVLLLWAIALWELLQLGRRLTDLYLQNKAPIAFSQIKSFALVVVGLGAGYLLMINPMSVILLFPLVLWLFIGGRKGAGRLLDIALMLLGASLVTIFLLYLGFEVLGNSIAIFWYFILLVAIQTISFPSALFISALIAAGLSLVIPLPGSRHTAQEHGEVAETAGPAASANS